MNSLRYALLVSNDQLEFVSMPASHMYQLTALNRRLHKEVTKLTASAVPTLPVLIAEFDNLDLISPQYSVRTGWQYINELEHSFAAIREQQYPLVSLLTEIRALQAQLEQWYEEEQN